jgi:hypothetical protein
MEKVTKGNCDGLFCKYYPKICMGKLRKITKTVLASASGLQFELNISRLRSVIVDHTTTPSLWVEGCEGGAQGVGGTLHFTLPPTVSLFNV